MRDHHSRAILVAPLWMFRAAVLVVSKALQLFDNILLKAVNQRLGGYHAPTLVLPEDRGNKVGDCRFNKFLWLDVVGYHHIQRILVHDAGELFERLCLNMESNDVTLGNEDLRVFIPDGFDSKVAFCHCDTPS